MYSKIIARYRRLVAHRLCRMAVTRPWVTGPHYKKETIDIRNSQRHREEGNARIHKLSAMGAGLAKIIAKAQILLYFESPGTDLHIAENACGIDYDATRSQKQVH
jgi:hypothetical protein